MTRPMPGPPTCVADGFPHERMAPHACLLHARSYHANSKRLKDDECEKERDLVRREYAELAEVVPYSITIPAEIVRQLRTEEAAWSRLTARPHALEES